jgi:hypothetical protein
VRAAIAAPNSSLSAADSTGEVDKRHCWVVGKTVVRSVLAGAMRSRGGQKGACDAFFVEQRVKREGKWGTWRAVTWRRKGGGNAWRQRRQAADNGCRASRGERNWSGTVGCSGPARKEQYDFLFI